LLEPLRGCHVGWETPLEKTSHHGRTSHDLAILELLWWSSLSSCHGRSRKWALHGMDTK
jgi:hypothetical protein